MLKISEIYVEKEIEVCDAFANGKIAPWMWNQEARRASEASDAKAPQNRVAKCGERRKDGRS